MFFQVYTHGMKHLEGRPTPRLIQEVNKSSTGYVDGFYNNGQWRFASEEDNVPEIVRVTVRPSE
jgi:hypothetical protein